VSIELGIGESQAFSASSGRWWSGPKALVGLAQFSSIQAAIDKAKPNSQRLIAPVIYRVSVTIGRSKAGLQLIGEGKVEILLIGETAIDVTAPAVLVKGIVERGTGQDRNAGA
jgi:pectin methylesterase-like acyl-CoA thioesterase